MILLLVINVCFGRKQVHRCMLEIVINSVICMHVCFFFDGIASTVSSLKLIMICFSMNAFSVFVRNQVHRFILETEHDHFFHECVCVFFYGIRSTGVSERTQRRSTR